MVVATAREGMGYCTQGRGGGIRVWRKKIIIEDKGGGVYGEGCLREWGGDEKEREGGGWRGNDMGYRDCYKRGGRCFDH